MTAALCEGDGAASRLRLAISSCLLGCAVRFDGGHKRDGFLVDSLGRHVDWVPICPEDECGLGTPRESMRLVKTDGAARLLTVRTHRDVTDTLDAWAAPAVERLAEADLDGAVLKKDSPTCGFERVKVYERGVPARTGRGLFAARLISRLPLLPVEDEGRLSDARLRENFIERVFAYRRLRDLFDTSWTLGALVRFHTAHKLQLMAHSPVAYQQLGRLVARATTGSRHDVASRYGAQFMAALAQPTTKGRHANVLEHMAGYLTDRLSSPCRRELSGTIQDYRRGLVPLVVPITLVAHHVRVHQIAYLAGQFYLDPHPRELGLRNHV
jgi:uncharacterized protein YbgA (DUF1722 family)/uncharacterized protein YbbK (DUF523 family)